MRKFLFIIAIFAFWAVLWVNKDKKSDVLSCDGCNVVVISLTSARADHLSAYGYSRNTSPALSKLASEAILFTNAFTQASRTVASGLSLFTSQYPYTHKVLDHWYSKKDLNPNAKSIAEILKEKGYKTAAFTGGGHYKGILGFDKGFDIYEDRQDFTSLAKQVPEAIDWLKKNKNNKFFLFLQGFDAHCPYTQPTPYDMMFDPSYKNSSNIDFYSCHWSYGGAEKNSNIIMLWKVVDDATSAKIGVEQSLDWQDVYFQKQDTEHLIALYDGSIAYADLQIQKVLDELGNLQLDKNTIIVFLGDHGELLGENGRFMRGGYLTGTYHDAVIHIPLIIKYPKIKAGKRIDGLVQLIDIAPTILESLNVKNYNYRHVQGKSLLPLIKTGEKINEYVYGGTSQYRNKSPRHPFTGIDEVNFIRNDEWKLIREIIIDYDKSATSEDYQLYNIKSDPKELTNILKNNPSVAEDLKTRLKLWEKEIKQSKDIDNRDKTNEEKQRFLEEGRRRGYW